MRHVDWRRRACRGNRERARRGNRRSARRSRHWPSERPRKRVKGPQWCHARLGPRKGRRWPKAQTVVESVRLGDTAHGGGGGLADGGGGPRAVREVHMADGAGIGEAYHMQRLTIARIGRDSEAMIGRKNEVQRQTAQVIRDARSRRDVPAGDQGRFRRAGQEQAARIASDDRIAGVREKRAARMIPRTMLRIMEGPPFSASVVF